MRTRRLHIEPLVESHARKLFHALQDLRLYRFYAGQPPATIDELERRYAGWAKRISPDGSQIWLNYALRRDDGAYVGWIQATIGGDVATIGYDVFPNFWRQGYGSEACEQLVRALCAEASVRRVVATVDSENLASIRLLQRLGFEPVWTGPSEDMPGRKDHRFERTCAAEAINCKARPPLRP